MSDLGENVPDPLAQLDQVLRELGDLAKIMASYYRALVAEGFTRREALSLTVAYQGSFLESLGRSDSEGSP